MGPSRVVGRGPPKGAGGRGGPLTRPARCWDLRWDLRYSRLGITNDPEDLKGWRRRESKTSADAAATHGLEASRTSNPLLTPVPDESCTAGPDGSARLAVPDCTSVPSKLRLALGALRSLDGRKAEALIVSAIEELENREVGD